MRCSAWRNMLSASNSGDSDGRGGGGGGEVGREEPLRTNGLGIADVETVGYGSVEPLFDSSSSSSSSHPDCKLTRSSKPVYGVAGVFSSVDEIEGRGRSNESILSSLLTRLSLIRCNCSCVVCLIVDVNLRVFFNPWRNEARHFELFLNSASSSD